VRERQILLADMNTMEELNELRLLKAERMAFKLVMVMPQTVIDQLQEEINDEAELDD
jgi:hypothetical protein